MPDLVHGWTRRKPPVWRGKSAEQRAKMRRADAIVLRMMWDRPTLCLRSCRLDTVTLRKFGNKHVVGVKEERLIRQDGRVRRFSCWSMMRNLLVVAKVLMVPWVRGKGTSTSDSSALPSTLCLLRAHLMTRVRSGQTVVTDFRVHTSRVFNIAEGPNCT
eukprot:38470-Eustigmatos_ZCMA.PRE.1